MLKSTEELKNELLSAEDVSKYICGNLEEFITTSFCDYLQMLLKKYQLKPIDVINKADIHTKYGYQIFNGERKPRRDKIIQLSIGFPLKVDEVQNLLKYAGEKELYPRIKRDTIILFGIKKECSVMQINHMLFEQGEDLLIKE